jgi:hypothetical protein
MVNEKEIKNMQTVVDKFTDMIQDGAVYMLSTRKSTVELSSYEVKAFTVGYLNSFLNKLAREIPEVREAIELELRIKQRSRDNYTY